jgi:membrane-associated phospholipid phosphatase
VSSESSARLRATLERTVLAAAIVALVLWVALGRINAVQHISIGVAGAGLAAYLAWRVEAGRWWAAYILGFVAFVYLRALADDTALAWRYEYAIDLDELLGAGSVPSTWLQARWYEAGASGLHDWLLFAVYGSYFFVPQLAAILIWRFRRPRLPRFVVAMLLTFAAGLLGAYLLPTAPPWLAAEDGYLSGVRRIALDLVFGGLGGIQETGTVLARSNAAAAMPSVHMAVTAVLVLAVWRERRALAVGGALYAGAMALALIYLGEHYAVDVLAGIAVALAAWLASERLIERVNVRSTTEEG